MIACGLALNIIYWTVAVLVIVAVPIGAWLVGIDRLAVHIFNTFRRRRIRKEWQRKEAARGKGK